MPKTEDIEEDFQTIMEEKKREFLEQKEKRAKELASIAKHNNLCKDAYI